MAKGIDANCEIGIRIRHYREKLGYTQECLAEKLGVSAQYISSVERGIVGLSVPILAKVSQILLVSTDMVLFGKENIIDELSVLTPMTGLSKIHLKHIEIIVKNYCDGVQLERNHE